MKADIYYMTNVGHEKDDMSYVHAKPMISHIELGERENYVIVDQTNVKTDDMEKASEKLFALYNGEANKRNPLSTKKKQEHLKQIGVIVDLYHNHRVPKEFIEGFRKACGAFLETIAKRERPQMLVPLADYRLECLLNQQPQPQVDVRAAKFIRLCFI